MGRNGTVSIDVLADELLLQIKMEIILQLGKKMQLVCQSLQCF